MLATYCGAAITVIASLALGSGLLALCGRREPTWLAGAVGYAILIVLASVLVRAPGRATTAVWVIALLALGGAWRARRWRRPPVRVLEGGLVALGVLALLGLPFLAAGHYGPLGVSLDDDLSFHIGWVHALAGGSPPYRFFSFSYPLGTESLAGCLTALGLGDEPALLGVTAAALALTAMAALSALARVPRALRIPVAIACGLPYLSAAFFGEGSLKEPIMALFVLGFALLSIDASARREGPALVAFAVAAVLTFGPPGLVWPAAFALARVVAARWTLPKSRADVARQLTVAGGVAAGLVVAGLGVNAVGAHLGATGFSLNLSGAPVFDFGGNFARQLPLTEGLGLWPGQDFRLPHDGGVLAAAVIVLAVALFLAALLIAVRRRRGELLLPALLSVAIYLFARHATAAYWSAKGMVLAAPLLVLFVTATLLERGGDARAASVAPSYRSRALTALPVGLASLFVAAVVWCSAEALASSPVESPALGAELVSLRPLVKGHSVLYLGGDQWAPEWLLGASVRTIVIPRVGKSPGPPFDFDSPPVVALDAVDFAITTRTLDASAPPSNWLPVRTTSHYELWARHGPTPPRQTLPEGEGDGLLFDCTQPPGDVLITEAGTAGIRPPPAITSPWASPAGVPLAVASDGSSLLPAGFQAVSTLTLPPGRYEISLGYLSAADLTLRVGDVVGTLPATLEPLGPLQRAFVVTSSGALLRVRLSVPHKPAPIPIKGAVVRQLHAVAVDRPEKTVPLREACGRYVDWYQLGSAGG